MTLRTKIKKYIKKPVEVEAIQWTGRNEKEVRKFAKCSASPDDRFYVNYGEGTIMINTLEGEMRANKGDFIVKGVRGELYPVKPDIFWETYEDVEAKNNESINSMASVASNHGVSMEFLGFDNGQSEADIDNKKVYIQKDEDPFIVMHEVAHCIVGRGCCKDHDEYLAHGAAIALCHAYNMTEIIPDNHIDFLQSCARKKCENDETSIKLKEICPHKLYFMIFPSSTSRDRIKDNNKTLEHRGFLNVIAMRDDVLIERC